MLKRYELIFFATLALIPYGVMSAIYNASSGHIAGSLGLSLDEASWFNLFYQLGQLLALPLASWLVYRSGVKHLLIASATLGLATSLLISFSTSLFIHYFGWLALGFAASGVLLAVQVQVLRSLPFKQIVFAEGGLLLTNTLLPAGIYPWLLAVLAENNLWRLAFAVQAIFYVLLLAWIWLRPVADEVINDKKISFNFLQVALISISICGLAFFLLRGNFYNWFDTALIVEIMLVTGVLLLLTAYAISKGWGRGEYLRSDVLRVNGNKVALYNVAMAGFAGTGTSILISSYLVGVLKYSHSELGWLQLPAFAAMLLGLLFSLWICNQPKLKSDALIPLGVLMIVISSIFLTNSSAASGASDMWLALAVRGLGIGLLNVTVTISILTRFDKSQLPQGVSYFYLSRTLGAMMGSALFSRLASSESASVLNVLGENFNPLNVAFIQQQNTMVQVLQQGMLEATPARVASLLSAQLQTQTAAVVGVNNFQWFLLCICILGSILISAKIWLAKSENLSH